jgi:hypothetical protein
MLLTFPHPLYVSDFLLTLADLSLLMLVLTMVPLRMMRVLVLLKARENLKPSASVSQLVFEKNVMTHVSHYFFWSCRRCRV